MRALDVSGMKNAIPVSSKNAAINGKVMRSRVRRPNTSMVLTAGAAKLERRERGRSVEAKPSAEKRRGGAHIQLRAPNPSVALRAEIYDI